MYSGGFRKNGGSRDSLEYLEDLESSVAVSRKESMNKPECSIDSVTHAPLCRIAQKYNSERHHSDWTDFQIVFFCFDRARYAFIREDVKGEWK